MKPLLHRLGNVAKMHVAHNDDCMGRKTPLKLNAFWKSGWFAGAIITLLFLSANLGGFAPLKRFELQFYDYAVKANMQAADARIVIINIDESSINRLGNWPWSQAVIGDTITLLSSHARLIGLDIFYRITEPPKNLAQAIQESGNTVLPVFFNIGMDTDLSNASVPDYISRMNIRQVIRKDPAQMALTKHL